MCVACPHRLIVLEDATQASGGVTEMLESAQEGWSRPHERTTEDQLLLDLKHNRPLLRVKHASFQPIKDLGPMA